MRMTKKRRDAEAAAATAALATPDTAGKRQQIRRLEGSIQTIGDNAKKWEASGFPMSAATARIIVERLERRLESIRNGGTPA